MFVNDNNNEQIPGIDELFAACIMSDKCELTSNILLLCGFLLRHLADAQKSDLFKKLKVNADVGRRLEALLTMF